MKDQQERKRENEGCKISRKENEYFRDEGSAEMKKRKSGMKDQKERRRVNQG